MKRKSKSWTNSRVQPQSANLPAKSPSNVDLALSSNQGVTNTDTSAPTIHTINSIAATGNVNVDHVTQDENATKSKSPHWKALGKMKMLVKLQLNAEGKDDFDIYHDSSTHHSKRVYMLHPNSKWRRVWEILTACCVFYVCTMVPLIAGFDYIDWSGLDSFNTFIDIYFLCDMVVTLRTGIVSNGEVIMDTRRVARKYFHTWFIVDLISNFPLALFVDNSAKKSLKIFKLQKIPKLLRMGKLLRYLREYAKYYNLAVSVVSLIFSIHIFTCLWANVFHECLDEEENFLCDAAEMPPMYIECMHIIVDMFLGISEGTSYASISHLSNPQDIATAKAHILSVTLFLLGLILTSFLFGNILVLLIGWDQQKAQFRNRMDVISAEMKYYELPTDIQHRVRRNYDYLWINQRAYSDMMLLNQPGISKGLRTTIALHLYKDLVKTVPFFAGSDVRFLGKVCLALETAVYLPGDTIIYYDDIGKEMFIVRKGLVEVILPNQAQDDPVDESKRIYLRDGNFFGETALVIDVRRTNTVKAVTICDLNVLSKSAFDEIVAEYPEFGERMKRTVIKRQLDNMNIQSPDEKRKVKRQLNLVVEKSLKARRLSVSLRALYKAKKIGDRLKEITDRSGKETKAPSVKKLRKLSKAVVHTPPTQNHKLTGLSVEDQPKMSPVTSEGSFESIPSDGPNSSINSQAVRNENESGVRVRRQSVKMDVVSRKMSKVEMEAKLLPSALVEISRMVDEIKKKTDRLERRLYDQEDECSEEEIDSEEEDSKFESEILGHISPVDEAPEEEDETSGFQT